MNNDIIFEDVTETAKKIRKYLKEAYPTHKFSVRVEKYAGGNNVTVKLKEPVIDDFQEQYDFDRKVSGDLERFRSYETDAMTDSIVPGYYEYAGKKYRGAKFIFVRSV